MADTKISALPASTTPLAGTEVLPIVQGGATRQVSVANLTTGRALSATQLTLTTGNLIVASGQGIDFSATSGTGTSELLNDYEEGTWTPSLGGDTTYTSQTGTYVKIGQLVFIKGEMIVLLRGTGSNNTVSGLPFSSTTGADAIPLSFFSGLNQNVTYLVFRVSTTSMTANGTTAATNVTATRAIFTDGARVEFSGCYRTSS